MCYSTIITSYVDIALHLNVLNNCNNITGPFHQPIKSCAVYVYRIVGNVQVRIKCAKRSKRPPNTFYKNITYTIRTDRTDSTERTESR